MDKYALLCRCIYEDNQITQREVAKKMNISLGTANGLVKQCLDSGLIEMAEDGHYILLKKGEELLEQYRVDGALIIAAGFGSRFVPLTFETPKGLLEVFGERMIERQIKQLHEVGIYDITIVVGYLKEKFDYLIDKYDVKLLYNNEYSNKNTLTTLYHAREILRGRNMYLLSSDNWMRENMFHTFECGAWYSAVHTDTDTSEWCLSLNKKNLIQEVQVGGHNCWFMYGPVFMSAQWLEQYLPVLEAYYHLPGTEPFYWEHVYMELLDGTAVKRLADAGIQEVNGIPINKLGPHLFDMYANPQSDTNVYEFENLEELRLFDSRYQTRSDNQAMELIAQVFQIPESDIHDIRCLKAGMTNKSFLFQVNGKHYICRIPGPGTELLINRKEEKAVYDTVKPLDITEHIIYFNGDTGYKIAEYYENARNADASNWDDMEKCMSVLKRLHNSGLTVNHRFNVRERIHFYENLCLSHNGIPFEDYQEVRGWMMELLDRLDAMNRPEYLSHLDGNVDNFLFLPDGGIRLIDWEYAGMCDPLIDIAMAAIYSYYKETEVDRLMETYLNRTPTDVERQVVYSYVALGGFLWSLWAVYKSAIGEEFGEYTLIMYRYAKTYYRKILRNL